MDFSQRLKELRSEHHYTQEQLANIAKISLKSVQRYEQGKGIKKPNVEYLLALAEVLDVTPEYLLKGEENMDSYNEAIKNELGHLESFSQVKEIHDKELNAVVLAHLKLTDSLVTSVRDSWQAKKLFQGSYCTRPYVQDVIVRYCQNRSDFREKFSLGDGYLQPNTQ